MFKKHLFITKHFLRTPQEQEPIKEMSKTSKHRQEVFNVCSKGTTWTSTDPKCRFIAWEQCKSLDKFPTNNSYIIFKILIWNDYSQSKQLKYWITTLEEESKNVNF